jgi:hypothetical protein
VNGETNGPPLSSRRRSSSKSNREQLSNIVLGAYPIQKLLMSFGLSTNSPGNGGRRENPFLFHRFPSFRRSAVPSLESQGGSLQLMNAWKYLTEARKLSSRSPANLRSTRAESGWFWISDLKLEGKGVKVRLLTFASSMRRKLLEKLHAVCFLSGRCIAGGVFDNLIFGRPFADADCAGHHWFDHAGTAVRAVGR